MFPRNFNEAAKSGFIPYILEASGRDDLCNTRTARVNAAIKDFKSLVSRGYNPNDYIEEILANHGLTESELTDRECEKIMGYVNGLY